MVKEVHRITIKTHARTHTRTTTKYATTQTLQAVFLRLQNVIYFVLLIRLRKGLYIFQASNATLPLHHLSPRVTAVSRYIGLTS